MTVCDKVMRHLMHWKCVAPFDLILLNTLFVKSFVEAAKKMSS